MSITGTGIFTVRRDVGLKIRLPTTEKGFTDSMNQRYFLFATAKTFRSRNEICSRKPKDAFYLNLWEDVMIKFLYRLIWWEHVWWYCRIFFKWVFYSIFAICLMYVGLIIVNFIWRLSVE